MTKYHDPKTGKTLSAKNLDEAKAKMKPKVTPKPYESKSKKAASDDSK
jgi:hypothetical protein